MKKIIYRFLIVLLMIFSFYYTNKIIEFLKEKDPIMQQIKETKSKYKIESKDASINNDSIIPGKKGKDIDYQKSYSKMRQYGNYNESLTVLKDIKPVISIDDNYDKFIISGNKENRCVSLVFKVEKDDEIDSILNILEKENTKANFFIDGTYLEKNVLKLKNMKNHEIEILNYNNSYSESLFKASISYLENITENKANYCLGEKAINICEKLKLHTIKPTLNIKNNLYINIKNNLDNGIIINIDINNYNEKELSTTINYIREKGYKIKLLKELLSEKN